MKTLFCLLCSALLLLGTPVMAASYTSPAAKVETADSVKADMKDQMAKLKQQHRDQAAKLRGQQKEQMAKLKADQKQQVAKLKADQKTRWQKFKDQLAEDDAPASPARSRN